MGRRQNNAELATLNGPAGLRSSRYGVLVEQ